MRLTPTEQKLANKLYSWLSRTQVKANLGKTTAIFSQSGKSTKIKSRRRTVREGVVRLR